MSLLSELLADAPPLATLATVATLPPGKAGTAPRVAEVARAATARDDGTRPESATTPTPEQSRESQESQGPVTPPDTAEVRAHLLALAETEGIATGLVRALPESELAATGEQCAAVEAEQPGRGYELARQYLRMLATRATMQAGQLPPGFDTPALCRHCGHVWLPRAQAAVLPVVGGWPRALGCPWCFVRLPEGRDIPRPRIICAECRHYQPDAINPAEGMGRCAIDANHGGTNWPYQRRACGSFRPKE